MSHAVFEVTFVSVPQANGRAIGLDMQYGEALVVVICPHAPAGIGLVLSKIRVVQHTFSVKLSVKKPSRVGASTTTTLPLVLTVRSDRVEISVKVKRTHVAFAIAVLSPSLNQNVVFKRSASPD